MRTVTILAGSALAALLALGGASWVMLADGDDARPITPDQVALGETIYADQCASCHGANLEGQPNWRERKDDGRMPAPPHDASGHTWHHPDDVLFGVTKEGLAEYAPPGYQTDMPAFGDVLTDEEIRAVLAYIKSRWPEEIRARQNAMSEQAE